MRRIRVVAQELQDKVGFAGSAYFGGTTLVDGPSAFRELFLADVVAGFADPVTFEPADEVHRQDVLGFQDRVAFQLSAPVPVRVLNIQKVVTRRLYRPAQPGGGLVVH